MSIKLADIAEQLGLEVKELKEKILELGFEIAPRARVVDDDVAELVLDELGGENSDDAEPESEDVADVYDEMIAQEREREIVKSQRKKTAGRNDKKKSADKPKEVETVTSKSLEIGDSISVKEFSEKTGVNAAKVIGELMKNGILANINQQIDFETAQVIGDDLGIKLKRTRGAAQVEDFMSGNIDNLLQEDDKGDLEQRPPVVCVMGHVDHGKTKLLDAIRDANVVDGESGGITQHIGAYQVKKKGRLITFLDTPGHEAFTSMRARGAKVTDIAILVVAANEGVKPQTIEAINHAKEAGVPIIVAINKMDLPDSTPDKVKAELAEHGLQSEDWGGDTVMVPISALKGEGVDEILDMILLSADMLELKANPVREAVGTVVEAHLDTGLGPVATILVNTGTLKVMNNVIVGNTYGRIKMMCDHTGKALRIAPPATPVRIAGLNKTPKSGDILQVVKDEKTARSRAEEINLISKEKDFEQLSGMGKVLSGIKSDKILRLVVKADTKGSLEAIKQSLAKIKDEEVAIRVIHGGVGSVTKSDVMMASASNGLVLGFHVDYDSPHVKKTAEREGVEVKFYSVIYALIEEMKKLLTGLLDAEIIEVQLGRAQVKQVFLTKKKTMILGCKVLGGKVEDSAKIKVLRGQDAEGEDAVAGEGKIDSLRKGDDVVKEVTSGNDCGIRFMGDIAVEEGDILLVYKEEEKHRSIS
ncbi:translation initiation factor IF-2 [Candidatus Peregrinibacteria bacterium]|jgi:translation initiation factor IF-2|nr:translation initiation factor IF-2 [Candidatus Peregrinibacteria bacterium]MBT7736292.1 translation initiation factor IF-2 [Candidatus Peregrinibacteria bacterium]